MERMIGKIKYKPRKGFYDLSKKPKTLTKREHEKIQETQLLLMYIEDKKDEYMKDKRNWKIAQEMSAKLQQVIFNNYEVN